MADESKTASGGSGRRWCVAVDGSHAAHNAFLTCMRCYNKGDFVQVVYASEDASKGYLPEDLKGKHIKESYEVDLVSKLPADMYNVEVIARNGKSARDAICTYVNHEDQDFDFLVVGCVGRKGPKADPTVLGTTADHSLRGAHCSSIISRKPPPAKGAALYVVAVDGSHRAHAGVEFAASVARADDKIVLLHVENDNKEESLPEDFHTDNIRARYSDLVAEFAESKETATVEFRVLDAPGFEEHVSDIINRVAHDEGAHMIVIGVDGVKNFVKGKVTGWGSVSDRIIRNTRISVACMQEKGVMYM